MDIVILYITLVHEHKVTQRVSLPNLVTSVRNMLYSTTKYAQCKYTTNLYCNCFIFCFKVLNRMKVIGVHYLLCFSPDRNVWRKKLFLQLKHRSYAWNIYTCYTCYVYWKSSCSLVPPASVVVHGEHLRGRMCVFLKYI